MRVVPSLILTLAVVSAAGLAQNADASSSSVGAQLQVSQPSSVSTPIVRGVRRESVSSESFAAGPDETLEIVFADGSSLTLASGAAVTVETFTYDVATRMGQLVVRAERGLIRVVGGVLNNTSNIRILTPHGEANIDNGIATIDVDDARTDVALLLGKSISIEANGRTANITRAGGMVQLTGAQIEGPSAIPSQTASGWVAALNPGLNSGIIPRFVAEESSDESSDTAVIDAAMRTVRDDQPLGNTPDPSGIGCAGCSLTSLNWDGPGGSGVDALGQSGGANADGWTVLLSGAPGASVIVAGSVGDRYTQGLEQGMQPLVNDAISYEPGYAFREEGEDPVLGNCPSDGCRYFFVFNSEDPGEFRGLVVSKDDGILTNVEFTSNFDRLLGCEGSATCYSDGMSLDLGTTELLDNFLQNPGRLIAGATGPVFDDGGDPATGFVLQDGFGGGTCGGLICRDADHFLLFDVRENAAPEDDGRAFLFASGAVTLTPPTEFTVDRYMITPGISDFAGDMAFQDAIMSCVAGDCVTFGRSFLGAQTGIDSGLYDPGLFVLTRPGSTSSLLFHLDFGLSGDGTDQQSSISALFGQLSYGGNSATLDNASVVASSARAPDGSSASGLNAITSPFALSAVGGGNAAIAGRAGYLVLDNFAGLPGGTERPVAPQEGQTDFDFAATRFATGVGQISVGTRDGLAYDGYAAGLQVSDDTGAVTAFSDDAFAISADASAATVTASLNGIDFGGSDFNSAYVDDARFGASDSSEGTDAKAALVSGRSVIDGWQNGDAGMTDSTRAQLENYRYMQWGFFFGDVSTGRDGSQHAHLASWVAGSLTDSSAPTPQGSATYSGHALGNVSNGDSVYTAVGTFSNSWDFNLRQGTVEMNFDNASYTGTTRFVGDSFNVQTGRFDNRTSGAQENSHFDGSIAASAQDRVGTLEGSFIDDAATSTTHVGVVGQFEISGSESGSDYTASGTFGGE